uniref:Uncharacterized protein n=1 Tax=viral metagenome TaxID=1070528 RepID=A0A6C0LRG9_9ZZZZ
MPAKIHPITNQTNKPKETKPLLFTISHSFTESIVRLRAMIKLIGR